MKILYLITRAERGGAQVHLLDLIRGYASHLRVELAAGEEGFLLDEARKLGVPCHVLPNLVQPVQPLQDAKAVWEIVSLLRRCKPDLLHLHTSKAGVLGRVAAFFCGIPAVFTAHTWCFAEGTSRYWQVVGTPLERISALVSKRVITVSDANRQLALLRKVVPPNRLVTIHNGVPDQVDSPSVSRRDPPIVIMVARFSPQKDQALLLEALAPVTAPFRLQFVGDGPTRTQVELLAGRLGLSDRVDFLGDRSDVSDLLRSAAIFVLSSNWEGFPLSILEAMRAGLPVVATDVGGVAEAVFDGRTGYLLARGDVFSLRERLADLLTSADLRRQMGRAGRLLFEERFTLDRMLKKTHALYQEVAFSSTSSPGVAFGPRPEQKRS